MMLFMVVGWLLIVALIVGGVWWLVSSAPFTPRRTSALDILRERYARGEISREEFESRRRDLAA